MLLKQHWDWVARLRESNEQSVCQQMARMDETTCAEEAREIQADGRSIPVICYRPLDEPDEVLPVLISIHGGGFIMAHAWMDGPYCRRIAAEAHCMVVSVEYRLAPEHPFPAGLEDCYECTRWVATHARDLRADPDRLVIGGYSAGANLSTAVCLMARERREFRLRHQILCYGPFDLTDRAAGASGRDNSGAENPAALFNLCYLQGTVPAKTPLASPLLAEDLTGLPDALLIVGSEDTLMRDSTAYAQRLIEAGVRAELRVFPNAGHAFTHEQTAQAEEAWRIICQRLHTVFSGEA